MQGMGVPRTKIEYKTSHDLFSYLTPRNYGWLHNTIYAIRVAHKSIFQARVKNLVIKRNSKGFYTPSKQHTLVCNLLFTQIDYSIHF